MRKEHYCVFLLLLLFLKFPSAEEHFLGEEATVGRTGVRKANWEIEALSSKRLVRLKNEMRQGVEEADLRIHLKVRNFRI